VLHQLRGFRRAGDLEGRVPLFTGMCDGHYPTDWLEGRVVGRIVGVSTAPLGKLLEPAAGYVDEDAANAAFDPGEFLDAVIAYGHEPYVTRGRDGRWKYYEDMTDCRRTEAKWKVALEQMEKRCAASTADQRIEAECVRRGLIR
jgi:hypothetical protein